MLSSAGNRRGLQALAGDSYRRNRRETDNGRAVHFLHSLLMDTWGYWHRQDTDLLDCEKRLGQDLDWPRHRIATSCLKEGIAAFRWAVTMCRSSLRVSAPNLLERQLAQGCTANRGRGWHCLTPETQPSCGPGPAPPLPLRHLCKGW